MCGIFGISVGPDPGLPGHTIEEVVRRLFVLSESRGKEAAGLAILKGGNIAQFKRPLPASRMIRTPEYRAFIRDQMDSRRQSQPGPIAIIGHSRLVTHGAQQDNRNNQPVLRGGLAGVHNGIIVNDAAIWNAVPELERHLQVDTEVLVALTDHFSRDHDLPEAVRRTFRYVEGTASVALLSTRNEFLLATNHGSLYTLVDESRNITVFASEAYILQRLAGYRFARSLLSEANCSHVQANTGWYWSLERGGRQLITLGPSDPAKGEVEASGTAFQIAFAKRDPASSTVPTELFEYEFPSRLKRCARCILAETMPFIEFDDDGVCNYCRLYNGFELLGRDALEETLSRYRKGNGRPDIIVAFSGGRDSSYGLHVLKAEFGMQPVAYTYDWGVITDLARRNQARMCGMLGIEHIIVSADIQRKRGYIRKNIEAWLKRPELGIIPLFMAGDKQFFYYANQVKRQTGIPLLAFSMNPLERVDFKAGFCGINNISFTRDIGKGRRFLTTTARNKLKLLFYYGKQYLLQPGYINASVFDTLFAYFSYYILSQEHLYIHRYIPWDETTVNDTLLSEYNWETANDTTTTWRIGDGTAAFYNYIYQTVAGFTENDALRSNQIREGMITRGKALRAIEQENAPRPDAIREYLDMVGVDCDPAIRVINAMPKLWQPA